MSINFCDNNQFDIYMSYGTSINYKYLNDLYLPIIGIDAINLYNLLISEYQSKISSSIYINNHQKIMKKIKIDKDNLLHCFRLLESVSLITTYQDNSNLVNSKIIYFINEPLNFYNFIQNENLNKLLKIKISDEEYTELKYKYNNHTIKSSFVNISKDISYLIDNNDMEELELDFETIYTLISKKINNHFIIDEICKEKINYFYKKHNLTFLQISDSIYKSLIIKNDMYFVHYDSLIINLNNLLILPQNINVISKVNRKFDFFLRNTNDEFYKAIYEDYSNFNSENYIISITKEELDNNTINLLHKLRNKFYLHDSIINCIIDYSIFHNCGKLIPKYIEKVASSINNLSINSLHNVVKYLRSVNANVRPNASLFANDNITEEAIQINSKNSTYDDNLSSLWKEIE